MLGVVAIIVVGKTLAAFAIVLAFRYPLRTALTVSASLAQIGEFSFILASLGVALQPAAGGGPEPDPRGCADLDRAESAAVRSRRAGRGAGSDGTRGSRRRSSVRADPLAELPEAAAPSRLAGHVIVVGYGRVGERVERRVDRGAACRMR